MKKLGCLPLTQLCHSKSWDLVPGCLTTVFANMTQQFTQNIEVGSLAGEKSISTGISKRCFGHFLATAENTEDLLITYLPICSLARHRMIQSQETEESCIKQHLPEKQMLQVVFHQKLLSHWKFVFSRMSNLGYCLVQPPTSTERASWLMLVHIRGRLRVSPLSGA